MTRPTNAVVTTVRECTDLIDAARVLADRAKQRRMPETARQVRTIARDLDGWRTRLVEDGEGEVEGARDCIASSADYLAAHAAHIGRSR